MTLIWRFYLCLSMLTPSLKKESNQIEIPSVEKWNNTSIDRSIDRLYVFLMFPLTCLEKTKMLYNDNHLHLLTFVSSSFFSSSKCSYFDEIFPICFSMMLKTARQANIHAQTMNRNGQLFDIVGYMSQSTHEITISDDFQSFEQKS